MNLKLADDRRKFNILDYTERILFYIIAAMMTWLCTSTMALKEQNVQLLEKATTMEHWASSLGDSQRRLEDIARSDEQRILAIETKLADHGWYMTSNTSLSPAR
jgi:hypothetical protein